MSGDTPPTWVFPFNRPPAPRDVDNQILAINTTDRATVYEVSFALVWATGDTVDNRNEAYALASCRDCRTLAVAFQVLLVIGQAHFAAPENIAVAVNYSCVQCVTYALASQLVVTLPNGLSQDATAELARIWAQLEEFGRNIDGMSVEMIQADLEAFKSRIFQTVARDAAVNVTVAPGVQPTQNANSANPATPPGDGNVGTATTPSPDPATTTTESPESPIRDVLDSCAGIHYDDESPADSGAVIGERATRFPSANVTAIASHQWRRAHDRRSSPAQPSRSAVTRPMC